MTRWRLVALLVCMLCGRTLLVAADPLQALAERLGLREPGGRATCGLPLTLYVQEQSRKGLPLPGVRSDRFLARPLTQADILRGHFRVHFDTTGTEEAAMLDGASSLRTLVSVIVPNSIPALTAVTIFHFFV